MLIDLTGRTALVTGGSRGIGLAIASRLSRSGANVVILARRADVLAESLASLRSQTNSRVAGFACDVSKTDDIDCVLPGILAEFPKIDILVNNAGSSTRASFEALTKASLTADMDLKVVSAMYMSQKLVPGMRERKWGRIINVLSASTRTPGPMNAPTAMSRWAGYAMTKIMAGEFATSGVLVNAVGVGLIESDQWPRMHKERASHMTFEEFIANEARSVPLGRYGTGEEFANAVCFLVSDLASYITGAALNIDGGKSPLI
jgi:NAD(P)-dependent dehydrogenase (short-subunit alcohol dehydrogenase family)